MIGVAYPPAPLAVGAGKRLRLSTGEDVVEFRGRWLQARSFYAGRHMAALDNKYQADASLVPAGLGSFGKRSPPTQVPYGQSGFRTSSSGHGTGRGKWLLTMTCRTCRPQQVELWICLQVDVIFGQIMADQAERLGFPLALGGTASFLP